jgi:inhibitor of growth protein 3
MEDSADEDMEEDEGEEYEDPRKGSSHKKSTNAASSEEVDSTLYCVCQSVSSGDMVGCDNENCPYEWFHFLCVGIKKQPKGSWVCDECKSRGFVATKN